jgi:FG-GAP-like repeat/FG-GAP repeat
LGGGNEQHHVGAGDFDGDGRSDLLWRSDGGELSTWQMAHGGAAAAYYMLPSTLTSWRVENTGDFNGDGRSDILLRHDDGSMTVWEMGSAAVTQQCYMLPTPPVSWHVQGVADFNGDGRADILMRNDNGHLTTWESGATGQPQAYWDLGMVSTVVHIQGTGDFNGDGRADILWRGDDGRFSIWLMANSGQAQDCFYVNNAPWRGLRHARHGSRARTGVRLSQRVAAAGRLPAARRSQGRFPQRVAAKTERGPPRHLLVRGVPFSAKNAA